MSGIEVERAANGCVTLCLNNQARRNALDTAMIAALRTWFVNLAQDAGCRVVILSGRGEHFCAGRDLGDFGGAQRSDEDIRADLAGLKSLITAMHDFPKPVLALVHGYALGLGAAIVALSDIAYAADDARFGFPEVKVGMSPTLTTLTLMRNVTSKRAMALLFTGAMIDGNEAERIGLISKALPAAELDAAVSTLSDGIASASPQALAGCKKLVRAIDGLSLTAALDQALDAAYASISDPDAIEGRRAFLAKRDPKYR